MTRIALAAILAALAMPASAEWSRYNVEISNAAETGPFRTPYCPHNYKIPICKGGAVGLKLAVDHSLVNDLKFNALPFVGSLHFRTLDGETPTPEPVSGSCLYADKALHCEMHYFDATIELKLLSEVGQPVRVQIHGQWVGRYFGAGTWKLVSKPTTKTKPSGNTPPDS